MNPTSRLWRWLALVFVLSFGALGWLGYQIHLRAPPIPSAVVSTDGTTLYTGDQIRHGQQAWLAAGGQQLGTVWGHGSYVAPDWSADWLHREAVALQEIRYGEQVTNAYAAAQEAQINVETEQAKLEAAKVSAQQKVVQAQAEADANEILAKSLTSAILQQRYLDTLAKLAEAGNLVVVPEGFNGLVNVGGKTATVG